MAFTITANTVLGIATVAGTNSSDSIAAAQLTNISSLNLNAYEAVDVVVTGATPLSGAISSFISMGQGDDQVTLSASLISPGSVIDLGEGSDSFSGNTSNLADSSIKGMGGLDTMTFGTATLTNMFVNGNDGGDRFTVGLGGGTVISNSTIVGGSDDDRIAINITGALTDGRINGQNGNDTITISNLGIGTTTTIYGGQGDDTLTAAAGPLGNWHVIFSGDLGNDTMFGKNQNGSNTSGDLLYGGVGNDSIDGGTGADTMTGGSGTDVFASITNGTMSVQYRDADLNGVISIGDTVNLNTAQGIGTFNNWVTNITDFSAEDRLATGLGTNAVSAIGQSFGGAPTMATFGSSSLTYKLGGAYNSANSTFTVTADNLGTDTLIALVGATADAHLLMKGTSASTLVAANFIE